MIGRSLRVRCVATFLSLPVSLLSGYTLPSYFQQMSGMYIYIKVGKVKDTLLSHSLNSINTEYVNVQKCRAWFMLFGGQDRRCIVKHGRKTSRISCGYPNNNFWCKCTLSGIVFFGFAWDGWKKASRYYRRMWKGFHLHQSTSFQGTWQQTSIKDSSNGKSEWQSNT